MKKLCTTLTAVVFAMSGIISYTYGQVIDFENFGEIINEDIDPDERERYTIDNTYFLENYCLQFLQEDSEGTLSAAKVAMVGAPAAGWDRTTGNRTNGCLPEGAAPVSSDMPLNAFQDALIGCYFLTTDRPDDIPYKLVIDYDTESSGCSDCNSLSGRIIDVDGTEVWTIEAFNDDASSVPIATVVIDANSDGAGDAIAAPFQIQIDPQLGPIEKVTIKGTATGQKVGFAFDNFSFCSIQPEVCGLIVEDPESLETSCDEPGEPSTTYNPTFQFANNTQYNVTSAIISAVSPEGFTFSQTYWNLVQEPIAPGESSEPITLEVTADAPITETTDVCFEVRYIAGDVECCHYTHCFTLRPSDPCASIIVDAQEDSSTDCCYDITLENNFCPDYFTGIRTEVLTSGIVFGSYEDPSDWAGTTDTESPTIIDWEYTPDNGLLPEGTLTGINFCLEGIISADQVPQQVAVHWLAIDADTGEEVVACTEFLEFSCNTCLTIEEPSFTCVTANTYTYSFNLINNSDRTANMIVLENHTEGIIFDPPVITDIALAPAGVQPVTINVTNTNGLPPGTIVEFKAVLFDETDWCCHLGGLSFVLEDCESQLLSFNNDIHLSAQLEGDEVILNWSVAETHAFTSFSIVQPGSNHTTKLSEMEVETGVVQYAYRHQKPQSGTNLYQVIGSKQDGDLAHSSLVSVLIADHSEAELQLYPNPSKSTLQVMTMGKGRHQLLIFDTNGTVLQRQEVDLQTGVPLPVDISQLRAGMYILRLQGKEAKAQQQRFIKADL